MAHLTIKDLERFLGEVATKVAMGNTDHPYVYVETGKYKPFDIKTVKAAIKRGYHVDSFCGGTVFYVYPKMLSTPEALYLKLQSEWEKGLTLIAEFTNSNGAKVKVLKEDSPVKGLLYTVLRYFTIGEKWHVSCDAQRVPADEAFKALGKVM